MRRSSRAACRVQAEQIEHRDEAANVALPSVPAGRIGSPALRGDRFGADHWAASTATSSSRAAR